MVLHFSWFVHIPNAVNIILGILISFAPISGIEDEANLLRWYRPAYAFSAFLASYKFGWDIFCAVLRSSKIGVSLESKIQRYYKQAARHFHAYRPLQKENSLFYLVFLLYNLVHSGIFLVVIGFWICTMVMSLYGNQVIASFLVPRIIRYSLRKELPCSKVSISGIIGPNATSAMLKISLAVFALFFTWPAVLYQSFSDHPPLPALSWIYHALTNKENLGNLGDMERQLMALAYQFNLTCIPESIKAVENGSLAQFPICAYRLLQQKTGNLTDFILPAICVTWGVGDQGNHINATLSL